EVKSNIDPFRGAGRADPGVVAPPPQLDPEAVVVKQKTDFGAGDDVALQVGDAVHSHAPVAVDELLAGQLHELVVAVERPGDGVGSVDDVAEAGQVASAPS